MLRTGRRRLSLSCLAAACLERQTASIFWLYFNRTCQRVIASNQVYPYLYRVMLDIMKTYTKDSFFRELAIAFGGDGLSPRTIGGNGAEKAVQFLKENESIDSALGRYVWGQAIRFFNNLETNKEWQAFIEEHKDQWIRMVLEEWEGKLIDGDTVDWNRLMDIVIDRFNVLGTEILLNQISRRHLNGSSCFVAFRGYKIEPSYR